MSAARHPVDRLAEFEGEIREHVERARRYSEWPDEEIVVVVEVDGINRVSHARRGINTGAYVAEHLPGIVDDYVRPVKSGHVTVIVVAPEGRAVFGVKLARPT